MAMGKTPESSVRASSGTNTPINSTVAANRSSRMSCTRSERRNSGRPIDGHGEDHQRVKPVAIHGGQSQRTVGRRLRTQRRVDLESAICRSETSGRNWPPAHCLRSPTGSGPDRSSTSRRAESAETSLRCSSDQGPRCPAALPSRAGRRTDRPSARPDRPGRRADPAVRVCRRCCTAIPARTACRFPGPPTARR